ncbi:MAG TPA: DUF3969 family protein [Candidatus Scatosoma pullicola]|nr:DUF3969 family protein [Candidatus Scatosoma pullicola]
MIGRIPDVPAWTGKDRKRNLTLLDESLLEEFMSIFSIGLPEWLKKKWIEPQRAEQWLFSLAMGYLSKKDFDESFRHAMGFASEMEAANRRLVIYAK